MLSTHFHIIKGKKLETSLVSSANRKYFDVDPTTFLSANWHKKNYALVIWTATYVFVFIGLTVKIAVSMKWWRTSVSFC